MTKDRSYSTANRCLNRIKTSNIDQILKIRLECEFIRLKRCILSGPIHIPAEDITTLEELSEAIVLTDQKAWAIAALEGKIQQLLQTAGETQ